MVLGWLINMMAGTINLPPYRVAHFSKVLDLFLRLRRTCSKKDLQKLSGSCKAWSLPYPVALVACRGCKSN